MLIAANYQLIINLSPCVTGKSICTSLRNKKIMSNLSKSSKEERKQLQMFKKYFANFS